MTTMRTSVPLFVGCIAASLVGHAQIVLEHTYPTSGLWSNSGQLFMVDLEVAGMSYVEVDRNTSNIRFYHLDHSLFKTISFANFPHDASGPFQYFMYISQHLFDLDDDVEFLYCYSGVAFLTQVYNEDGSLLLDAPGAFPWVAVSQHNQDFPVYNTPGGTKLILSHADGTSRVYGLGGTLNIGIALANGQQFVSIASDGLAFPNPAADEIRIPCALAPGSHRELVIMNAAGNVVRTLLVPQGATQAVADVRTLAVGTYTWLMVGDGQQEAQGTFIRAR